MEKEEGANVGAGGIIKDTEEDGEQKELMEEQGVKKIIKQ